jgi:hypothetical protein
MIRDAIFDLGRAPPLSLAVVARAPNLSNMTEALASKTRAPCRGGVPPLTPEQAGLLHATPQTGNWRRKLTASTGASGFKALTFLPNIGELTRF